MAELRFGRVSSIDYKSGMISVYYPDRSGNVTDKLPMLSNGEINMPNIGAEVAVLHLTNDCSKGLVLGKIWNERNKPLIASAGVFYKEFERDKAFVKYDTVSGKLTVKAPSIEIVKGDDV